MEFLVTSHPDKALMARAIEAAQAGAAAGDYRLGALVAGPEGVLAEAYTDLESTQDPTAHAEVRKPQVARPAPSGALRAYAKCPGVLGTCVRVHRRLAQSPPSWRRGHH
jgi:hypothetical protein